MTRRISRTLSVGRTLNAIGRAAPVQFRLWRVTLVQRPDLARTAGFTGVPASGPKRNVALWMSRFTSHGRRERRSRAPRGKRSGTRLHPGVAPIDPASVLTGIAHLSSRRLMLVRVK
jgi:hypothetical protein